MTIMRGRPVDMAKHLAIIDAALKILTSSEEKLTIERVAHEAGVSRTTVYNHFGNLAELEVIVLFKKNAEIMKMLDIPINRNQTLHQALVDTGCMISGILMDEGFLDLIYILIAKKINKKKQNQELQHVVDVFYGKCKLVLQEKIVDLLEWGVQRGEIRMNSSVMNDAAEQLLAMWQSFQFIGLMVGAIQKPSLEMQHHRVVGSVDLILNAYKPYTCVD